jgi:PBSX family phage portal protein
MTRPILTTAWIVGSGDDARIVKAASESQQLPEDPFNYSEGEGGLMRPPYDLDQLAAMLEGNTLHARACRQKATDVAGRGFALRSTGPDGQVSDQSEAAWGAFVAEVENDERGDESFKERIEMAAQDFESVGWGILEVSRRGDGLIDGLWHIPGHTVRAHKDGKRFAQVRSGKLVWFKRYGLEGSVNRADGGWSTGGATPGNLRGNEVLVVRNYTPRSSYYGLPDHIPAMAAIAGWRAQAEFNIRFFDNNAVPSYAVVIEGADVSPAFEEKILDHFRQLKGNPHSTLVLPVPGLPGDDATQVKVTFEKLSTDIKDASFRLYKQDNALEICIAHGVPPYRIGWPIMGSLGGATAEEMTEIYNDSIVQPRQETWEQRLTRALLGAKGLNLADVILKANELDTRNETRDVEKAKALWEMDALVPDEARSFFGMKPLPDDRGAKTKSESAPPPAPNPFAAAGGMAGGMAPLDAAAIAKRWTTEVTELSRIRKRLESLLPAEVAA